MPASPNKLSQLHIIAILFTFPLFLLSTIKCEAQHQAKVDSLRQLVSIAREDTNQVKLLIELGKILEESTPDTALYFYGKAIEISERIDAKEFIAESLILTGFNHQTRGSSEETIEYFQKALEISREIEDKDKISRCFVNIGLVFHDQGSCDKAIEYYLKSLEVASEADIKRAMTFSFNNLGRAYYDQGSYEEAIAYYLKALKIQEETGDKRGMPSSYNNIGLIHYEQSSHDKAIEYMLKALAMNKELDRKRGMSICYHNIGMVFHDQGSYDKAIEYYAKGLLIFEELGHKRGIAVSTHVLGMIHLIEGRYDKASEYLLESLNSYEELDDKMGIAQNSVSIAELNIALADSVANNEAQKRYYLNEAVNSGTMALELAEEMELMPVTQEAANALKKAHTKLGNHRKALESAEIFVSASDSMFKKDKTRAILEIEAKYETEKKQQQIELQESQLVAKDATIRQQKTYRNALGTGFLAVILIIIIIVYAYIQKQKDNQKIKEQNELISGANEELIQLNEEISVQKEEIEAQRDQVFNQNQAITDSISYAERIQSAMLPPETYITELLHDNFILFKPRDIVSGDYYWIKQVNQYVVIVAADCTGHGVPGAFMSMLGISYLTEIVQRREITQANQVLNEMRKQIKYSLRQHGDADEAKDGIDMALCVLDLRTMLMQYSGANNPLYLIREVDGDPQLIEYKADKMPLGYYQGKDRPFTNHEVKMEAGDTFYLFSDGFIDQKGGKDNKRYMSKAFKSLLLEIQDQSMQDQKRFLNKRLSDWMGSNSQIDDILVIGVRV